MPDCEQGVGNRLNLSACTLNVEAHSAIPLHYTSSGQQFRQQVALQVAPLHWMTEVLRKTMRTELASTPVLTKAEDQQQACMHRLQLVLEIHL
jgi:hypothetical protein